MRGKIQVLLGRLRTDHRGFETRKPSEANPGHEKMHFESKLTPDMQEETNTFGVIGTITKDEHTSPSGLKRARPLIKKSKKKKEKWPSSEKI